jgi:hypothetical protein
MFMLRLVQEMSARRYKCLGTLDIRCSDAGNAFMLFHSI